MVHASMLIRSPPPAVFEAASGALGPGATVTWQFMVPGASEAVHVTEFEVGRRLVFRSAELITRAMGEIRPESRA